MATWVNKADVLPAPRTTLLVLLLAANSVLLAADTEVPEMDFLEYLGSWEESDEDWVLLSDEISAQVAADDTLKDSQPERDAPAEKDDES